MKKVEVMSYDEAVTELQLILSDMQSETLLIDDLTSSVKRASELLQSCRDRLHSTEKEVNSVIKKLGLGE